MEGKGHVKKYETAWYLWETRVKSACRNGGKEGGQEEPNPIQDIIYYRKNKSCHACSFPPMVH